VSDRSLPISSFDAEQLTLRFGVVVSLRDVSFEMRRGEILAVNWSERRGQDVTLQLGHRVYQLPRRIDHLHGA